MRALKAIAAALAAVLFIFACGGGGNDSSVREQVNQPQLTDDSIRGTLDLQLSSESYEDGSRRVLLHGRNARDLYQIAGTLEFDPALYEVIVVEAGGGLGDPENSYFLDNLAEPGRLDFAYTRRWHGDGVDGNPLLLSVKLRPIGAFDIADFRIDSSEGRIRIRDSRKRNIEFTVDGREAGNE